MSTDQKNSRGRVDEIDGSGSWVVRKLMTVKDRRCVDRLMIACADGEMTLALLVE